MSPIDDQPPPSQCNISPVRSSVLRLLAILILLLAMLAAAAWHLASPYVRATSLVVRSAGLESSHPMLASWQRQAVAERAGSVPSRQGSLRAKFYIPARAARAVLLVPGVNAMAIDEPRLIGFARQLAATGLAVVTPDVPDLRHYEVTPRSADLIEDAAGWLAGNRDLCPDGRIGLIGISFAGGLSVVAAGRPSVADRVAFVLSFGGHGEFQRVMRYLCTGVEPDPGGTDAPGQSGSVSGQEGAVRRPPHDYGVAVMVLDLAHVIVPPGQAEALRRGVLVFLEASHLALYDTAGAEREFARARDLERDLPEPAATLLHLVNTRDVDALGRRLLPFIRSLGEDPALSPERSPAPKAPVFLLHGSDDNVVPAMESRLLARHLAGQAPVHLLLSPLITHAEVNRTARAADVWRLIAFWADVLRQ